MTKTPLDRMTDAVNKPSRSDHEMIGNVLNEVGTILGEFHKRIAQIEENQNSMPKYNCNISPRIMLPICPIHRI